MTEKPVQRRLAAIAVADVVGYSRLMEADEAGTLAALKNRRKAILEPVVREHGGRIVKVMGDGVLIEFASAVNAVKAALELQDKFAGANGALPEQRRIVLRIGINLGDVIGEGSDIYGDGVNIASRLETIAEPGGICISAKVHDEVRGKVEAAFDDLGERQLKNIAHPVRAYRWSSGSTALADVAQLSGKLSIAVLPFDNMSGDPGQQYISDGITEDITTELARFSGLSVASRLAAFHHGGKGKNPTDAARALGVAYVVEGSVRKSGARLRITAQLIDTRTGNHVWADRYDRNSEDIFAIQDEVVAAIVSMLEGRMATTEAAVARAKPAASWSAYDYFLQGRELCNRHRDPEAVPFFVKAVSIDPQFALAHAWLSIALTLANIYAVDPSRMAEADRAADRALELDVNDAASQWAKAMVLFWRGDHERARPHFDRAIALNPADIQIQGDYANWQRVSGNPTKALTTIERLISQGPYVPDWFAAVLGLIHFDLEHYAEAVEALENLPLHYLNDILYLAAARAQMGDGPGAAQAIAKLRISRPDLSLRDVARVIRYRDPEPQQRLTDGLRKAGLPE
jgi:adenylate cyclase